MSRALSSTIRTRLRAIFRRWPSGAGLVSRSAISECSRGRLRSKKRSIEHFRFDSLYGEKADKAMPEFVVAIVQFRDPERSSFVARILVKMVNCLLLLIAGGGVSPL